MIPQLPDDAAPFADIAPGAPIDPVMAFYRDIDTPGAVVTVDPEDAERAGAFEETALSADEAADAVFDARKAV